MQNHCFVKVILIPTGITTNSDKNDKHEKIIIYYITFYSFSGLFVL